ncbi:unnamed protein product, partial [Sphacelaria rigidula]
HRGKDRSNCSKGFLKVISSRLFESRNISCLGILLSIEASSLHSVVLFTETQDIHPLLRTDDPFTADGRHTPTCLTPPRQQSGLLFHCTNHTPKYVVLLSLRPYACILFLCHDEYYPR